MKVRSYFVGGLILMQAYSHYINYPISYKQASSLYIANTFRYSLLHRCCRCLSLFKLETQCHFVVYNVVSAAGRAGVGVASAAVALTTSKTSVVEYWFTSVVRLPS